MHGVHFNTVTFKGDNNGNLSEEYYLTEHF